MDAEWGKWLSANAGKTAIAATAGAAALAYLMWSREEKRNFPISLDDQSIEISVRCINTPTI